MHSFKSLIASLAAVIFACTAASPVLAQGLFTGAKFLKTECGRMNSRVGVVDSIDANGITIREVQNDKTLAFHTFAPIEVLSKGEVLDDGGSYAYRWKDVMKEDVVCLRVIYDEGEKIRYCMQISIHRRPGAELPKSQNPKNDTSYAARRVFNAIDNGEDVSDEELLKVFPPQRKPGTGEFVPGGLLPIGEYDKQYCAKLDQNRKRIAEEKDKNLKAKPQTDPMKK